MLPGREPDEPRVEDRAATPAGPRRLRLRLRRLRPRQLPGSSRSDHQCGKAWSGERDGPAPCLSQSGTGAGPGRDHVLRGPLARLLPAWRAVAAPNRGTPGGANCVVQPAVSLPVRQGINQGTGRCHLPQTLSPLGSCSLAGREFRASYLAWIFTRAPLLSPCLQVHR